MSSTSVNPGRWLRFEARLELVGDDEQLVYEPETLSIIELSTLLQSFREDPSDPVIGRVQITIEPAP